MIKFLRTTRAATAIEFALIAPIFFLLFIGIIEFGLTIFVQSSLDIGIRNFARAGITQTTTFSGPAPDFIDMMNSSMGGLFNPHKASLRVNFSNVPCPGQTSSDPYASILCIQQAFFEYPDGGFDVFTPGTFNNRGTPILTTFVAPNMVVLYGVRYDWGGITQLLTPFIPKELYAFTIVRNENFTP